jgi:hypothetical protein
MLNSLKKESKDFDNYYNIPNNPKGILEFIASNKSHTKNIYPNIDVVSPSHLTFKNC